MGGGGVGGGRGVGVVESPHIHQRRRRQLHRLALWRTDTLTHKCPPRDVSAKQGKDLSIWKHYPATHSIQCVLSVIPHLCDGIHAVAGGDLVPQLHLLQGGQRLDQVFLLLRVPSNARRRAHVPLHPGWVWPSLQGVLQLLPGPILPDLPPSPSSLSTVPVCLCG